MAVAKPKTARKMTRNLSRSLHEACQRLRKQKYFNGLYVLEAKCMSYEDRVKECREDGMTLRQAERWAKDYTCVNFHLDTYDEIEAESEYTEVEFNFGKLEKDFMDWLLAYIGDASCRQGSINLSGGDTEFTRPGAKFPLAG